MKGITVNTYEMSDIHDKFLYYDIIGSNAGF